MVPTVVQPKVIMSTATKTSHLFGQRAAAKRKFGGWSARAAQWAAEYKKAGGGYRKKPAIPWQVDKALDYKDGKPLSARTAKANQRPLFKKAWSNCPSPRPYTDKKKRLAEKERLTSQILARQSELAIRKALMYA